MNEQGGQNNQFNNFDDFVAANNNDNNNNNNTITTTTEEPLHKRRINRDDDGSYGNDVWGERIQEQPVTESNTFRDVFPKGCITWEKIAEMFSYPQDRYDKIMSVCMFLALAAALNPMMTMFVAWSHSNVEVRVMRFAFALGILGFFLISLIAANKSFSLIVIGIITVLKFYPFSESAADAFFTVVFMGVALTAFKLQQDNRK
jgi:hypothetical protein